MPKLKAGYPQPRMHFNYYFIYLTLAEISETKVLSIIIKQTEQLTDLIDAGFSI